MKHFICGFHAVNAALKNRPQQFRALYIDQQRDDLRQQGLLSFAKQQGVNAQAVSKLDLQRIVPDQVHQGVAAELESLACTLDLDVFIAQKRENTSVLVLDGVTDPHNLGACFRVACAAGIQAIIVPKDKSAAITATVAKAASGALEYVSLIQVPNLARALTALKNDFFTVVGADERGEQTIHQVDMRGNMAFVLGREGDGLRELTKKTCDTLVKIPMLGEVESLNVSVCAGVILFERVRQLQIK